MIGKRVILFYYFLHAFSDVFGDLINPLPQNKAVLRGSIRVAFNCSSTNGWGFIGWGFIPVGESVQKPIASGSSVAASYRDTYEVSQPGDQTSTLTIKTVNESLAGTYFCNEPGGVSYTSQLIVYNSDPVCTSSASSVPQLYQGQSVRMSCSFSYSATNSSVIVNMVWTKGSPTSPVNTTTGTTGVSTINQIVGYSSPFPPYQCQTSFRVTGNTATNVPSYSYTKLFPSVTVFYFNPNCSIIGANSGDRIYFGKSISCKADANPPPTYRWSDGTNSTLSDTSTVQISSDGEYRCTARNSISSCQVSINLTTYTTTIPPATTTTTNIARIPTSTRFVTQASSVSQSTGVESSNSIPIVVGVVVGVGGSILVIVVVVVAWCYIRKKRTGEMLKKESTPSQQRDQGSTERRNEERTNESEKSTNHTNGNYEMLTNRPAEQPQIYCQLRPLEQNNPDYYNINN